MKNLFKNILRAVVVIAAIGASVANAQFNSPSPTPGYTAVYSTTTNSYNVVLTNAAKIAQVQVIAGASAAAQVDVYDNNLTNFYTTNAAYATLTNYTSNVVYQTISPLTGVTNNFTNSMLVTAWITNAASSSNVISYRSFVAAPSTMGTYPVNMIMSKGIALHVNTNATVLVTYRPND